MQASPVDRDSHINFADIAIVILDDVFVLLAVKHTPQETAHPVCPPPPHRRLSRVHGGRNESSRDVHGK